MEKSKPSIQSPKNCMSKHGPSTLENGFSLPRKKFVVVHNIPSPYRLHMFRLLCERLAVRGIDFHVHFMACSHQHRRHWHSYSKDIPFPHTFWRNIAPTIKGRKWDFNPGMIAALLRQRSDYLMVGGPWDSLTGLFVSLVARRSVGIAWAEGNTHTPGLITGWPVLIKRFLLHRFRILAVPGGEGRKYMQLIVGDGDVAQKIVTLPNIVDEALFQPRDHENDEDQLRSALGVRNGTRFAIWPARLISDKGVCEFLSCLKPEDLKGWTLVILGEGPLKQDVMNTINKMRLEESVRLISYLPYDQMPSVYRTADLYLLPSILDPNPLSVVEAMHSGLPILISKRIGNYPEALREGRNGWGIDPLDHRSVRTAVEDAFSVPVEVLRRKGSESRKVAADFWGSTAAIDAFLNSIPVRK